MGWGGASVAGAEGVLGAVDFLPAGLGLSAQGALVSAGGELMGARVYDPVVGGFLAPDPLEPVAGAGWAGASCAFAGNDPVNLVDPTGLQPITVEQMKQYFDYVKSGQIRRDALNQFWEDIKRNAARFIPSTVEDLQKFWEDFWRDPVAWMNSHPKEMENTGLVIIATALLFTPAAPLAAGFLSEMGFSWLEQRWSEGKIDPTRLQIDGAIGAGSAGVLGLGARLYRGLRAGRHINFETSFGRASLKDGTAVAGAQRVSRGSSVVEVPALFAQGSERQAAWSQLRQSRYPQVKVEVRPVTGAGARSAVEVPPVAVSRVDGSRVASVQGSGVSRGGSQVPLKPVEAPLVGEVRPVTGVGSGAAGMQAVKPGGVVDDAVVVRGSAGGVRESGVQLRPVEEAKVEGLDTVRVQRVARDEHLVPAAHGQAVPELAERGVPNGGGTFSRGFYNAPRADDYLKSRINWEGLKGKRVKYPDKPNIQYVDNLKKLSQEVRNYRTAQAQIKAENAEIKEYNKAVRKQAKLDGVEEGSPGYEIKEHKRTPPEPKLRIFRDDFVDSKGEKMVTDYTSGMYGTDPGVNKYLVLRPSEYAGEIPQEAFDLAKEVWTKGGNLHPDARFQGFKNELEYRLNIGTSEEVKHTYVPLPTRMTNVPKKGDPQEFMDLKYYEATIKIPGEVTAEKFGTHRLVIANNGTMYYTPDHYRTFILIKE